MDALDILTDLDNVVPFFQPIFSADEHRVIGYEILGRYKKSDKNFLSLGPYFLDDSIPEEFRLELDNMVLRKALHLSTSLEKDILLFVNRDADLLLFDEDEHLLQLLLEFDKKGISMERVVIEISFSQNVRDTVRLSHLINYYRTYGLKIAFDKLGDNSQQIDLIGHISPHILKVDLQALRSTDLAQSFQDIIYSYSLLARKIGATLLFENIEMVYQLQYAWKNGGRFYQGYYLHKPDEHFVDSDLLKEQLRKECQNFINSEKKKLEAQFEQTERFQTIVTDLLQKHRKTEEYKELLMALGRDMEHFAFRLYICDEDGFQLSPNIYKYKTNWILQSEYLHKNWSWRPYFLENILRMRREKKGILSDLYSDIETGENIRTFSYPLRDKQFLFIDISNDYILEHLELL